MIDSWVQRNCLIGAKTILSSANASANRMSPARLIPEHVLPVVLHRLRAWGDAVGGLERLAGQGAAVVVAGQDGGAEEGLDASCADGAGGFGGAGGGFQLRIQRRGVLAGEARVPASLRYAVARRRLRPGRRPG